MSTVYNASLLKLVKLTANHQTKHNDEVQKYMGVDANDQLLKYSQFSKRTVKWWKVFFRILNVCMVLFKEYKKSKGEHIKCRSKSKGIR